MKLKQRVGDFRVRELLIDGYLVERGEYRVYLVIKRKLTTPEAAKILAAEAGVPDDAVGVAGWKDRQAITTQYMSVPRGRVVEYQSPELKISPVGFAHEALTGEVSRGNSFEINVRGLGSRDTRTLRGNLDSARKNGVVNYFDDQRFGNLTHGQGWIAKDLMLGRPETALKSFLLPRNPFESPREKRFRADLERDWGDWRACRDAAGRYGAHHSVFEHLARNQSDFAGAFGRVSKRLRLIHLFAWQSHLWNRAVVDLVRSLVPGDQRLFLNSEEGALVTYAQAPPAELLARVALNLPGEGLDDLVDPGEIELYEDVLARERMVADQLRIPGLAGFRLKTEPRELILRPEHLRVRPAEPDPGDRQRSMVRVRFELPRGAYATLVIKRLLAGPPGDGKERRGSGAVRSRKRRGPHEPKARSREGSHESSVDAARDRRRFEK